MTTTANDDKARALLEVAMPNLLLIKDAMDRADMLEIDLLRALYLIENIKSVSQWGKVIIKVSAGEITSVSGENTFIAEKELRRNLKTIQNNAR